MPVFGIGIFCPPSLTEMKWDSNVGKGFVNCEILCILKIVTSKVC